MTFGQKFNQGGTVARSYSCLLQGAVTLEMIALFTGIQEV